MNSLLNYRYMRWVTDAMLRLDLINEGISIAAGSQLIGNRVGYDKH
jgi:hypothetical protein